MNLRVINTEDEKKQALHRLGQLLAMTDTPQARYEIAALRQLILMYENRQLYSEGAPSPLQAIKIRMVQRSLAPRDLEPFIGSKSRVSEVLSGKRPLTLEMIRALSFNLGIPADILLQAQGNDAFESFEDMDWAKFPLREMMKKKWIAKTRNPEGKAKDLMEGLVAKAGGFEALPKGLYRKNDTNRKNAKSDPYALMAWAFRVLAKARENTLSVKYQPGTITVDFLRQLARLSFFEQGPLLAKEWLAKHGIHLVVEAHLTKTYLDGVAMKFGAGTPLIGLTLRYDRIDNFWFTLMHELAHIGRHLDGNDELDTFFDDHSLRKAGKSSPEDLEAEADEWAEQALKPYDDKELPDSPTREDIMGLASRYQLHPVIIAGQIRYKQGNYKLFPSLRGQGEVRRHFEEVVFMS